MVELPAKHIPSVAYVIENWSKSQCTLINKTSIINKRTIRSDKERLWTRKSCQRWSWGTFGSIFKSSRTKTNSPVTLWLVLYGQQELCLIFIQVMSFETLKLRRFCKEDAEYRQIAIMGFVQHGKKTFMLYRSASFLCFVVSCYVYNDHLWSLLPRQIFLNETYKLLVWHNLGCRCGTNQGRTPIMSISNRWHYLITIKYNILNLKI